MMQIGMLDEAFVHKEILLAAGLLGVFRLDDVARDAHSVGLLADGQQAFLIVVAEQPHDALLEVAGIQMIEFLAVAGQGEADLWVHQRDAGELFNDMSHLGLGRLEEVASRRDVEKQVLDGECGARLHRNEVLLLDDRAFVDDPHAHFILFAARLQLHLRDGGDAGQSLATETHGPDGEQVLRLADFGSGMTLETHTGIRLRHATAVVDDHNHGLTSVFNYQVNLGGASIQRVLHQLLDG